MDDVWVNDEAKAEFEMLGKLIAADLGSGITHHPFDTFAGSMTMVLRTKDDVTKRMLDLRRNYTIRRREATPTSPEPHTRH